MAKRSDNALITDALLLLVREMARLRAQIRRETDGVPVHVYPRGEEHWLRGTDCACGPVARKRIDDSTVIVHRRVM